MTSAPIGLCVATTVLRPKASFWERPDFRRKRSFARWGWPHFNGRGGLTWVEHTVINGVPANADFVLATGTYSVNANCTGSAVVTTPNSPVQLRLSLVTVKDGKEFRTILDASSVGLCTAKSNSAGR